MAVRMRHTTGFGKGKRPIDFETSPAPAVMAKGLDGSGHGQYVIEDNGVPAVPYSRGGAPDLMDGAGKPPYRVPTMAEVAAVPWNGLTVASTFAGCGGSSTGYRMAGYRVLWASEFVPAAQDSYRANMREGTVLDPRDVKLVQASEILSACGLKEGELDVFDGSPPCQAFSTAGKRHKGWGTERSYEHGAKQLNEDLFFEYVRLLRGLMPRAFVAENVSGLVKGVAKGYFLDILAALKASGYRVRARVLDAQWLGVPQVRQRVIFVGVRDDLGLDPAFPKPLPYRYSVREAVPWLMRLDMGAHGFQDERHFDGTEPSPTVMATGLSSYKYEVEARPDMELEVRRSWGPGTHKLSKRGLDQPSFCIPADERSNGMRLVEARAVYQDKYGKPDEEDLTDAPSRAIRAKCPGALQVVGGGPEMVRRRRKDRDAAGNRLGVDGPSPAITTDQNPELRVEGAKVERRKFTIAELRRICSFPDDFVLTGSYAQQWERLGNSVPPLMMRAIAEALRDGVLLTSRPEPSRRRTGPRRRPPAASRGPR